MGHFVVGSDGQHTALVAGVQKRLEVLEFGHGQDGGHPSGAGPQGKKGRSEGVDTSPSPR